MLSPCACGLTVAFYERNAAPKPIREDTTREPAAVPDLLPHDSSAGASLSSLSRTGESLGELSGKSAASRRSDGEGEGGGAAGFTANVTALVEEGTAVYRSSMIQSLTDAAYIPEHAQHVAAEIKQTEETYVSDLQTMIDVYMKQSVADDILNQNEAKVIFGNVEQVHKANDELLGKLQSKGERIRINARPLHDLPPMCDHPANDLPPMRCNPADGRRAHPYHRALLH